MVEFMEFTGRYRSLDLVEWDAPGLDDMERMREHLKIDDMNEAQMAELAEAAAALGYLLRHRASDLHCLVTRNNDAYEMRWYGFGGREVYISDRSASHSMFRRFEIKRIREDAKGYSTTDILNILTSAKGICAISFNTV